MSKYSVNSTKQEPFKTGLRTKKFIVEGVVNNKNNEIINFALTVKDKVKLFPIIKGDFIKGWRSLEAFINSKKP